MGKRYDQLDLDDRIEICRLHAAGKSRREIDHLMGRDASTINRELRRNSLPRGEYKPPRRTGLRSRGAGGSRRSSA